MYKVGDKVIAVVWGQAREDAVEVEAVVERVGLPERNFRGYYVIGMDNPPR